MASLLLPGFRQAAVLRTTFTSPFIASSAAITSRVLGNLVFAGGVTIPAHQYRQPSNTICLLSAATAGLRFFQTTHTAADKDDDHVKVLKKSYKETKRELKDLKNSLKECEYKNPDTKIQYEETKRLYKERKLEYKKAKHATTSDTIDITPAVENIESVSSIVNDTSEPKITATASANASPLGDLARKITPATEDGKGSRSFHNDGTVTDSHTVSKGFAFFLLGSAASVLGIVVFGGLTRLTESGLSITQWKPVTGSLPPMSGTDWEAEFALYRSTPEYAKLNPNMDLDEFKRIYFMEWFHRVWGRFIGVSYFAGLLYFAARKGPSGHRYLSRRMLYGATAVLAGIGAQGFVGWWMVASGLTDDLFAQGAYPRVSHYRLATHLAIAFSLYTAMFLMGTRVLRNRWYLANPAEGLRIIAALQSPQLALFRRLTITITCLVFLTAMSGALVAGLDAGLIYNEFPLMGNGLAPPRSELFDHFYCRKEDGSDLVWRNIFENPSTVQLDHRILAISTLTAVLALWGYSRSPRVASTLPVHVKKAVNGLVHLTLFQVALGISTLIYMVPIPLGALHQAGSLLVLTGALGLAHRLHIPKSLVPHLKKRTVSFSGTQSAAKHHATHPFPK